MKSTLDPVGRALEETDVEARIAEGDQVSLKLWLRMLACTHRVEAEVRARLREEFGISLARFDLLAQLERCPDGLKMNELSRRLMVTGGNVTGLTDQLESEGLVVRTDDPKDRRAFAVKLTSTGRTLFNKMAAKHEKWIAELFSGLTKTEQLQSYRLLGKLKDHVMTQNKETRWPKK
jgi:DNA-binding MarR family transcriptional regulator